MSSTFLAPAFGSSNLGAWTPVRSLSACLVLGYKAGWVAETEPVAQALEQLLGDARPVKVLKAVGALLRGDASVGQAELANERYSGEADAGTLVFAMVDRLAGGQQDWRLLVDRVLAISSDPMWRAVAYEIQRME